MIVRVRYPPPGTAVPAAPFTSSCALPCIPFRAADGKTCGFEQDAAFYQGARSAEWR